jgi:hypothetical protein
MQVAALYMACLSVLVSHAAHADLSIAAQLRNTHLIKRSLDGWQTQDRQL